MHVRGGGGTIDHYTDDSGLGSFPSSAVGSVRSSSSAPYLLPATPNCFESPSDQSLLPPVAIRLLVPELDIETTLQLNQNDTVWNIKQCVLSTIATNLDDGINHGFYCPPVNGRAGKYLDEERYLGEYGLQDDTVLQLVLKKRLYKTTAFDWKKIQEYNTKTRCKKLIHYLRSGNFDALRKLLAKGVDPNFHDAESWETPLTMSANLRFARDAILVLVEGGAILDYRNRLGLTSLHKAAQYGNKDAVQTLLELGASPNYKDIRGLTPLYYTVCNDTDPACAELLLRDYATLGTRDDAGWTELHQCCRYGLVQHLQHLIFYGSDVNGRNYSGNTPLHICALNNQEECARILLFRGADKTIRNFINQNPEGLSIFSGFHRLAEVIREFNPNDIVLHQETPRYNTRRRRKSYHSSDNEPNLLFFQKYLSRSASNLADSSSDLCVGSQLTRRKSIKDNHYQSISRNSSLSRMSVRSQGRSEPSSRPSSRMAFDEPEVRSTPQKTFNSMSCDAASQRARARSKSRNFLEHFKVTKKDSVNDRCSSVPPPSSPPGRGRDLPTSPSTAPVTSFQNVSCLREVLRPRYDQSSNFQGSNIPLFHQNHVVENRSCGYDPVQTGYQMKSNGMPWNQSLDQSAYLISNDGNESTFRRSHSGNLTTTQRSSTRVPLPHHHQTSEEVFVWSPDKSSSSRNPGSDTKRSMPWTSAPVPPPPPPRKTNTSQYDRISEEGTLKYMENSRGIGLTGSYQSSNGNPVLRTAPSQWMTGSQGSSVQSVSHSTSKVAPQIARVPVHRGVEHGAVTTRNDITRNDITRNDTTRNGHQRSSALSPRVLSPPRFHHAPPKSFQIVSPPPSPLPPFPDIAPCYFQDSKPLPPPPRDISNPYPQVLTPPPMFNTGNPGFSCDSPPPPPPPLHSSSHLPPQVSWRNPPSHLSRGVTNGGGGVTDVTDVQSALFAAVLRRRQALNMM